MHQLLLTNYFSRFFIKIISHIGTYAIFCFKIIRSINFSKPYLKLIFYQMEFVGVKSFVIIMMSAIMIGAVFGIQFGKIFQIFGAESMIGAAASFALSKELAPVVGAFLVTGRAGSSMTAEISNMKVNDQIDAMSIMAVNPIGYLAAPRVIASMLMLPVLTIFFCLFGILSAYAIGVWLFAVDVGVFMDKIKWISKPIHLIQGLEKAMIFGFIFSTIACFKGFYASGGARGVGKATTDAVVISLVIILISDFFISYAQMSKVF